MKVEVVADLLPVLLKAGLAREVASVVDGLQLPENPPARKNVHPEPNHPTSLSSFYLFPQTFTNKSIHWRAVFTFCQHMMQSTTSYPAVSLQTESVRVGTRPLLDTPASFHQSERSFQILARE